MTKKRQNKSKEQIAYEMKMSQEATRKRKIVGDVLFPLLMKHAKNITQAKMFCKVAQNDILTTFNNGMAAKLETLNMAEKVKNQDDGGSQAYAELLEAFKDTSISETLELLDGMPNAIDAAITYTNRELPFSDFEWDNGTLKLTSFESLLKKTPQCNDFRQMADGSWVAYSTVLDENGVTIRYNGPTIQEALEGLIKNIV